nr:hypothetical protein [Gammaproteobacteria bacterium]
MNIPKEISGRKVTNRGVHSLPFPYHGDYMGNETARSYWLGLMQSMHMSWVVLLTDGDSVLQKYDGYSVYEHYLRAGMNPVIRYLATLPYPFFGQDMVRGLVREAEPYGVTPFVQLWNEPGDPREWKDKKVPANWWDVFVGLWNDAAGQVLDLGAYPGFPDGPGYNFTTKHPFAHADHWHEDGVWYAVHNYGKGRPLD